jgi:hypothetical protein
MTRPGSLQTRMARQELAQARADVRLHAQCCASCPQLPCEDGEALADVLAAARDRVAAEETADRAPAPGQEVL